MTVNAWLQHLGKFDKNLDVIVRVEGEEGMYMATKPTIHETNDCSGDQFVAVDMTNEDEGVEGINS